MYTLKDNNVQRSQWGSKIGFILAAGGSAVGLGNIWRFPYLAGENGGGAFVLIYLITVAIIGFTLMLAEFTIGRYSQSNAVGAFKNIDKRFGFIGFIGVIVAFLIMGFYMIVGGWSLAYIFKAITGTISTTDPNFLSSSFNELVVNDFQPIFWGGIYIILNIFIVSSGINKGIEKASKILMPALFVIMIILTFKSLSLEGAMEGVKFFIKPNFSEITPKVVLNAAGQAFFSLSLGMTCMVTYGSYLNKSENLVKNAMIVPLLDTLVAIMAGFVILPAVFAFGFTPEEGPSLAFVTIPAVFTTMGTNLGTIFSTLFFILLTIAAITSSISLLEIPVAYLIEQRKWTRRKAVIITSIIVFVMCIFSSLSKGSLSHVMIGGKSIFDLYGFLTSNILQPFGGLMVCLFLGWILGKKKALNEATNEGTVKFRLANLWIFLLKYIIPVLIFLIFLSGLGVFNI
ncbi:sodium-dependent transporter [Vallitalea guaymasensis]|uniref:Transporter n=1 Tax=Vallitalea guaymasensis TaxID=1185412 RepID=A0A8J8ME49_9FIRM|nr:sodium-dependent transporter [Vallitalea guaymasensis]QUH31251.1 sodium-dependent transporter [Vallitalea guaymasensis]